MRNPVTFSFYPLALSLRAAGFWAITLTKTSKVRCEGAQCLTASFSSQCTFRFSLGPSHQVRIKKLSRRKLTQNGCLNNRDSDNFCHSGREVDSCQLLKCTWKYAHNPWQAPGHLVRDIGAGESTSDKWLGDQLNLRVG